jgi:hypothetical protein
MEKTNCAPAPRCPRSSNAFAPENVVLNAHFAVCGGESLMQGLVALR